MKSKNLEPITVANVTQLVNADSYIENELLMFDNINAIPVISQPKRMQCLLVALCVEGTATYVVDTKAYEVNAGDMIIISEGQVIGSKKLSADCRGLLIMASDSFFHEVVKELHELSSLFLFSHSHPVFRLHPSSIEAFKSYYNVIRLKLLSTHLHFRKEIVLSLLKTLLYEIGNEIWQVIQVDDRKHTRAETIFLTFIHLVEQNYRHERRVAWYAEQLYITPKYLSEAVKTVSRRTPNDWIDNYVILEIRVMLSHSSMSIKEIASELHFPSQSFLGKFFKEHVGMSPSQYRKQ